MTAEGPPPCAMMIDRMPPPLIPHESGVPTTFCYGCWRGGLSLSFGSGQKPPRATSFNPETHPLGSRHRRRLAPKAGSTQPLATSHSLQSQRRLHILLEEECLHGLPPMLLQGSRLALPDDEHAQGERQHVADEKGDRLLEEAHPEKLQRDEKIDADEDTVEPVRDDRQEAVLRPRCRGAAGLIVGFIQINDRGVHRLTP